MLDLDFAPGTIIEFRGRMSRGSSDSVPSKYAISEKNCEFFELGVKSRSGFDSHLQLTGNWNGKAIRVYEYKKRNEASRLIILDDTGQLWDSSTPMTTPILSIPGMVDFSATTIFDRVFISPHDGERGLANEIVYVYDGTATARAAAGSGPSGYTLAVANSGVAGVIEAGTHLFSVAFETTSGHITTFGIAGAEVNVYNAPGGKKADVSGIPTGGSSIVARLILATKKIDSYDGNPKDKEWFLLPNGRIANNIDTTLSDVNFYDSDLVDSVDRLFNQLGTIPAGGCITSYGSRLVVAGERANDATARVSDPGYPESFSDLDGHVNFDPGDAGEGVRHMFEYHETLYAMKDYRTYFTADNGAAPSTWKAPQLDGAIGSSVHGSSGVLDSKGQTVSMVLICSRAGVHKFVGTYGAGPELTYMIEDDWLRINTEAFKKISISIDPIQKKFYICAPLDTAAENSHMFVADFNEGLEWDKIKWSLWEFPKRPSTSWVEVDFSTKRTRMKFGSLDGGLYVHNKDSHRDFDNAINSFYRTGNVSAVADGSVCQFQAIRARVIGSGSLYLKMYGMDNTTVGTYPSFSLASAPGRELIRLIDFQGERAAVEFGVTNIDDWFKLTAIRVAGQLLWETQWQS